MKSPKLFKCPGCGGLGDIDDEQRQGKVSIICDNCGWHGSIARIVDKKGNDKIK